MKCQMMVQNTFVAVVGLSIFPLNFLLKVSGPFVQILCIEKDTPTCTDAM